MSERLRGIPSVGDQVEVVTQAGTKRAHVTGDAWPGDLGVEVPIQYVDGVQSVVYFSDLRKSSEEEIESE